ncbi:MAG: pyrimidine-nucleoside phosphorylase [Hydrogenoanaerobacterium sp.]
MRMYDIIMAKRGGAALTDEQIKFVVEGFTTGDIPDYQVSALLMAIYFKGMNTHETAFLTDCMAHSGDMIDLSPIPGIKVDKHSTGGVGDKTSLVITPIVAACGVPVAKMSGRGLGHTGGTIDKLESIPGFKTSIDKERFFEIVKTVGLSIIGQTGNIAPADKKLYALRDVTATVDNLSLIASSIMSKKLAAGSNAILLDVKTGSGAFMKTLDDSIALAQAMVNIGEHMGRKTVALITDMDIPLGSAIGNSLEVTEAVDTLHGKGPADFTEVCLQLASNMLFLADKGDVASCRKLAEGAIANGSAFAKLRAMTVAQGGDPSVLDDTSLFARADVCYEVKAPRGGYITHMNTEQCGIASVVLGAGRASKEASIDYSAGIILCKKVGDKLTEGDVVAKLYTSKEAMAREAEKVLLAAVTISDEKPNVEKLIYARVTKDSVERY